MIAAAYDLVERTVKFGETVIDLFLALEPNPVVKPLISQFVCSATSISANSCIADAAATPRDFRHKIAHCRKESRVTMHWCRMLTRACPAHITPIRALWKEAEELNKILFYNIFRKINPATTA
jgi:four helix bundle protein